MHIFYLYVCIWHNNPDQNLAVPKLKEVTGWPMKKISKPKMKKKYTI